MRLKTNIHILNIKKTHERKRDTRNVRIFFVVRITCIMVCDMCDMCDMIFVLIEWHVRRRNSLFEHFE